MYENIFLAHFITKKPLILHGSSGEGKSASVKSLSRLIPTAEQIKKHPALKAVAERGGFKVIEKRLCYLDSLTVTLPVKDDNKRIVTTYVAEWIYDLSPERCTEPTVLFLDEFNRPANSTSFHLMTELLLDRKINNIQISDNVLIVAAANLSVEDVGVVEIPNATLQRLTNLLHVPTDFEQRTNQQFEINKRILTRVPELHSKPEVGELVLKNCSRQRDTAAALAETGLLTSNEIAVCARGLLGVEAGTMWAGAYKAEKGNEKSLLPSKLDESTFQQLSEVEQNGAIIEVQNFLANYIGKQDKQVADYLVLHATPETCRSLITHHKFSFMYSYATLPEAIKSKHKERISEETNVNLNVVSYILYLEKKLSIRGGVQ